MSPTNPALLQHLLLPSTALNQLVAHVDLPQHQMPNPKYQNLHVACTSSSLPHLPWNITFTQRHPDWLVAMNEELNVLDQNKK